MDIASAPARRGKHQPRQRARPLQRLIEARLADKGHTLDELMAAWFAAGCEWPDVITRIEQLTGERVAKNTLKRWYPWYRLPMPGG